MDTNAANGNGGSKQVENKIPQFSEQTQSQNADETRNSVFLDKDVKEDASNLPERLVPEKLKWECVKQLETLFYKAIHNYLNKKDILNSINAIAKTLQTTIEDSKFVNALGDINMEAIRYIVKILELKAEQVKSLSELEKRIELREFLRDYMELCSVAFDSKEKSSEPVREQIFQNICNSLNIPDYPLKRLDKLYDDFKDPEKRKGTEGRRGIDIRQEMQIDLDRELKKQPGILESVKAQFVFWDTMKSYYSKHHKSERQKEVVGREWNYWYTKISGEDSEKFKISSPEKFLIRQSRIQSLKKLIDGEMSLEDMKKESEKLVEMRSWKTN